MEKAVRQIDLERIALTQAKWLSGITDIRMLMINSWILSNLTYQNSNLQKIPTGFHISAFQMSLRAQNN